MAEHACVSLRSGEIKKYLAIDRETIFAFIKLTLEWVKEKISASFDDWSSMDQITNQMTGTLYDYERGILLLSVFALGTGGSYFVRL